MQIVPETLADAVYSLSQVAAGFCILNYEIGFKSYFGNQVHVEGEGS